MITISRLLLSCIITFLPAAPQLASHPPQHNVATKPQQLFTKPDADKIMGSFTHLTDSVYKNANSPTSYLCGFQEATIPPGSDRPGVVYFLYEQYMDIAAAKKKYADIMKANKPNGITELHDLGDEAYYHTDGKNFHFVMVRKGKVVFNIKVNKITRTTSYDEFMRIAKRITAAV